MDAKRHTAKGKIMNKPPASLISSYRKKQQMGPWIIWGIAALLLLGGILLIVVWLTGPNAPQITLFASETPTPTNTATLTNTPTVTNTPVPTDTPTVTLTPTPSEPFSYTVQENEYLYAIAEKFQLGDNGITILLFLNPEVAANNGIVQTGQTIIVPNPGFVMPTATPIPSDTAFGTKIEYTIQLGDTLAGIASQFNSTVEDIKKLNKIENENEILVGQVITIRVNIVTPTNTSIPTITPGASETPTATVLPGVTVTP
jgi:LysM repeat protein